MDAPHVRNVCNDQVKNIRYVVMAYRQLTQEELLIAVRIGIASMKKKPKKNSEYVFYSVIDDGDVL